MSQKVDFCFWHSDGAAEKQQYLITDPSSLISKQMQLKQPAISELQATIFKRFFLF